MLRSIIILLLLGALVNGDPPELVTPSKLLEDFAIDSSKKRRSRTHADAATSPKKGRNLFNSEEADETFMSRRLDENTRLSWENGSFNALRNTTPTRPSYKKPLSQQVPGGEINYGFDTTGLINFLSKIQAPDHYLYMLYYPQGNVSKQMNSCFYIGVSKDIQRRLFKEHVLDKKNEAKWEKFHGKTKLKYVGICQLFKGSKGDCLHLERQFVAQGKLLGLNLVNITYKTKFVQAPDETKTEYFRKMMELGLETGEKYDTRSNYVINEDGDHGSDSEDDMLDDYDYDLDDEAAMSEFGEAESCENENCFNEDYDFDSAPNLNDQIYTGDDDDDSEEAENPASSDSEYDLGDNDDDEDYMP